MRRWLPAPLLCALFVFTPSISRADQNRVGDAWETLGPTQIGGAFDQIANNAALTCNDDAAQQVCASVPAAPVTFGGVRSRNIEAVFVDGRLSKVTVSFSVAEYEALLSLLTDRFGAGEDRSYLARAGMAGEFTAGVYLWRTAGVILVLEQYAGKIDRTTLTYGSEPAMAKAVRKATSYPRGARRDL
jgi:hypothetical protein